VTSFNGRISLLRGSRPRDMSSRSRTTASRRPESFDVTARTTMSSCPVDIVRGRSCDRPSDTFVHKGVLERVVARAERRGRVLLPSLSDLIVMKAWAVVDQERLASKKGGAGGRRAAYEADARRIADVALRRNALDRSRVEELLAGMRPERARAVRAVLVRIGVLET